MPKRWRADETSALTKQRLRNLEGQDSPDLIEDQYLIEEAEAEAALRPKGLRLSADERPGRSARVQSEGRRKKATRRDRRIAGDEGAFQR